MTRHRRHAPPIERLTPAQGKMPIAPTLPHARQPYGTPRPPRDQGDAAVLSPHEPPELRSVTVVGQDLGLADAYATSALAMGLSGLDWLAGLAGHESAAITEDGRCFRSERLPTVPAAKVP